MQKGQAISPNPETLAPDSADQVRLSAFMRQNVELIVAEWITFAKTRTPASTGMTKLALRDHIEEILNFIADDIDAPQTGAEQVTKSKGLGPPESGISKSAAEIHAALRLRDGFDIDQMVSEYRALRASVIKQWTSRNPQLAPTDLDDLTRFNEAIDQAMSESVAHYTKSIERSRNLFLGVLGHDLRNPIGAALMSARAMLNGGDLGAKESMLASQIASTTDRAITILNDLLDITRTAFGNDIPIEKTPMDMGQLARQLVDEMQALSKDRPIELAIVGDTMGEWDGARIGQVLSNLIGNALEHSADGTPIKVTVADHAAQILLSVHNSGAAIPPEKLDRMFDGGDSAALTQATSSTHLGLGLYITKKIATAHGGSVRVSSTTDAGTTVTVLLPRH